MFARVRRAAGATTRKRLSHGVHRKAIDEEGAEQIRAFKEAVNTAARKASIKRGLDWIDFSSTSDQTMG
eukprot:6621470-Prymnesium_polylepis.1